MTDRTDFQTPPRRDEVKPLSAGRLQAIRLRAACATDGPWFIDGCSSEGCEIVHRPDSISTERIAMVEGVKQYAEPDAEFIARARQDIPALLAEIDRLDSALSAAEGDVKRMDTAQRLLFAADFEYGPDKTPVVLLRMPDGVGVSGKLRAFLDDAAAALPILATPGAGE